MLLHSFTTHFIFFYLQNYLYQTSYVTCSLELSRIDPKTDFELYTLLERGDSYLSNDIRIVFVLQILSNICHII